VRNLRDADAMLNAGRDLAAAPQTLEASAATLDRWRQAQGWGLEWAGRRGRLEEESRRIKELAVREGTEHRRSETDRRGKLASPARRR
jgi:hypothetical protein